MSIILLKISLNNIVHEKIQNFDVIANIFNIFVLFSFSLPLPAAQMALDVDEDDYLASISVGTLQSFRKSVSIIISIAHCRDTQK